MTPHHPAVGIGVAYYGGLAPGHAECMRQALRAGYPVSRVMGCAYPEMSRAELCRQGLEAARDGLECLVLVDHDVLFTPEDLEAVSKLARRSDAIVLGYPSEPGQRLVADRVTLEAEPLRYGQPSDCAFCAIPVSLLSRLSRAVAEEEGRQFLNTPFVQGLDRADERQSFWPLFSPFTDNGVSLDPFVRCSPDRAFLLRAQAHFEAVYRLPLPIQSRGPAPPRFREVGLQNENDDGLSAVTGGYAIAVACFGALDTEQQAALWELEKAGAAIIELHGCPLVDVARDELTRRVLAGGFEGMLMLDHDIVFIPQMAVDVCQEAADRQAVVGVPYCMRKTGHALIGAFALDAGREITFFEGGSVLPAAYAGMGFTAIPRSVLERAGQQMSCGPLDSGFAEPSLPLFSLRVENGFYAGEDVSFCTRVHDLEVNHLGPEQWKMKGRAPGSAHPEFGAVYLDTRHRIFHKGSYHYGIEDVGIAVPRLESLRTQLTATKDEARAVMVNAGDGIKRETAAAALGLDPDGTHPLMQEATS